MNARALHPGHPGPGSEWLAEAEATVQGWTDRTHAAVMAASPYTDTGVRTGDWLVLVAHVSLRKEEDPTVTAGRLAAYVTAYRERYARTLNPAQVKETQT